MGCFDATKGKPQGELYPVEEKAFITIGQVDVGGYICRGTRLIIGIALIGQLKTGMQWGKCRADRISSHDAS
jgi:hypothetical protein